MRGPDEDDEEAALGEALDELLRFGAMALRSGATAFRVREWMGAIARGMGIDSLAVHISLGAMTASLRRGRTSATLASEVAPIGINAWRIGALEKLAVAAEAGILPVGLRARLDAIEAVPAIHGLLTTALGVAAASGAFSYINGGGPAEVLGSMVAGGIGQTLRSLMLRRHLNQYAVTAICAVLATSIFCVILELIQAAGFPTPGHAAGFISSALFLVPGFPLVAALLDMLQHQINASLSRLAYGVAVLMAAAFGLSLVAAVAGLTAEPPPPLETSEAATLLLRAIASFAGGCGFAILYNSSWRTVLAVGCLAVVGNEIRLALFDAGMALAPATLFGALAVGLLGSAIGSRLHEPRMVLT
ncbi:MAG TPA: threonine/serine exporter family protein, partial [Verrucomicrobiae bacterium]|nr:threonine/serine exporter family protein [Verrucomicrobiae bacterium]